MSPYNQHGTPGTSETARWRRAAVVLLLLSALLSACGTDTPEPAARDRGPDAKAEDSVTIVLYGHDSLTVLDLLLEKHTADVRYTDRGAFVAGIDGIAGGSGAYWLYSVNDTMGSVAADQRQVAAGDVVTWHLRKTD